MDAFKNLLLKSVERLNQLSAELTKESRAAIREQSEAMQKYLQSEEFERDLDLLAKRIGVDGPEYRALNQNEMQADRVARKGFFIMREARSEIVRDAIQKPNAVPLVRNTRAQVALAAFFGAYRGGKILYEAIRTLRPHGKPKKTISID